MSKITEYTRVNNYDQGDVILIDGTNGTRTLPVEKAGIGLDPTFTQTGKAADAKETGDKLGALKSDLDKLVNLAGDSIISVSDISSAGPKASISADTTNNTVTVASTSAGTYTGAFTASNFANNHFIPGAKYRMHCKAEKVSGSPSILVAVRGTQSSATTSIAGIDLGDGGEGFVDFVATEYINNVALFVTTTDYTSAAVLFSELWIREVLDQNLTSEEKPTSAKKVGNIVNIPGDSLLSVSDITVASEKATISVDSVNDTVTVTSTAAGTYTGAYTNNLIPKFRLIPGKMYRLHCKAEINSGTPDIKVAVQGTENDQNQSLANFNLKDGQESFVDFIATEYIRRISLFITSTTFASASVTFSKMWLKELSPDNPENYYKIAADFNRETIYEHTFTDDAAKIASQGLCTDGTYLYAAVLLDDTYGKMLKLSVSGEVLIEKNYGDIGHMNQLAYNPNENVIYSVGSNDDTIQVIDPSTLNVIETINLTNVSTAITSKAGTFGGFWIIAYDSEKDVFIVGNNAHFAVTNNDFTHIYKICVANVYGRGNMIYPDGDILYASYAGGTAEFAAYDWTGRTILTFNKTAPASYNYFEGICQVGDYLYVSWYLGNKTVRISKETVKQYKYVPVASVQKQFNYLD